MPRGPEQHPAFGRATCLVGRVLITAPLVAVIALGIPGTAEAQPGTLVPDARDLESGDLLWPKEPGAIVPYSGSSGSDSLDDRSVWQTERDRYLDSLRRSRTPLTSADHERFRLLNDMTYSSFLSVYTEGAQPGADAQYGGGVIAVGHVAIVRRRGDRVMVVEAMPGDGVRELDYQTWLDEREGQLVWHGRLRRFGSAERSAVAEQAARQIGRAYSFWNFDLADRSSFYCSKLVWQSVLNATGVALDDDPSPSRLLWVSPYQLLNSTHLQILHDPGDYSGR